MGDAPPKGMTMAPVAAAGFDAWPAPMRPRRSSQTGQSKIATTATQPNLQRQLLAGLIGGGTGAVVGALKPREDESRLQSSLVGLGLGGATGLMAGQALDATDTWRSSLSPAHPLYRQPIKTAERQLPPTRTAEGFVEACRAAGCSDAAISVLAKEAAALDPRIAADLAPLIKEGAGWLSKIAPAVKSFLPGMARKAPGMADDAANAVTRIAPRASAGSGPFRYGEIPTPPRGTSLKPQAAPRPQPQLADTAVMNSVDDVASSGGLPVQGVSPPAGPAPKPLSSADAWKQQFPSKPDAAPAAPGHVPHIGQARPQGTRTARSLWEQSAPMRRQIGNAAKPPLEALGRSGMGAGAGAAVGYPAEALIENMTGQDVNIAEPLMAAGAGFGAASRLPLINNRIPSLGPAASRMAVPTAAVGGGMAGAKNMATTGAENLLGRAGADAHKGQQDFARAQSQGYQGTLQEYMQQEMEQSGVAPEQQRVTTALMEAAGSAIDGGLEPMAEKLRPFAESAGLVPKGSNLPPQELLTAVGEKLDGMQDQLAQLPGTMDKLAPILQQGGFDPAQVDELLAAGRAGDVPGLIQGVNGLVAEKAAAGVQSQGGNFLSQWLGGMLGPENPITQFLSSLGTGQAIALLAGGAMALFGMGSMLMGGGGGMPLMGGLAMMGGSLAAPYLSQMFGGEQTTQDIRQGEMGQQPGPYGQPGGNVGPTPPPGQGGGDPLLPMPGMPGYGQQGGQIGPPQPQYNPGLLGL
jgi:hypothetical protein